ncbi:uncharacterized protein LOC116266971 [Nymphaea colorata]|nr:uncharacterized protein LOC116266971 [Nymphaea colorata]
MDREPEQLRFLGFFGIYKEALKIIHSRRRLFGLVSLTLILPLSVIFLANYEISAAIFAKINQTEATPNTAHDKLRGEWAQFWLFKLGYLIIVVIFSLLSTSAVVYMVACVYAGKDMTYRKIMAVVPRVWKRLMVTFFWLFIIGVGYNLTSLLVIAMIIVFLKGVAELVLVIVLTVLYLVGLVYLCVVWQLAGVISVLEEKCGWAAMAKGKELIKGKLFVASAIFVVLSLIDAGIHVGFVALVVQPYWAEVGPRVGCGFMFLFLLCGIILLGLVTQSIIYFVCKSYHHESIDKSGLSDHLELYGKYVRLSRQTAQTDDQQSHV